MTDAGSTCPVASPSTASSTSDGSGSPTKAGTTAASPTAAPCRDSRRSTDEILSKIRYLNQVAISMRAGLLDTEGAAAEIDLTERQLHEIVERLKAHAGVEG